MTKLRDICRFQSGGTPSRGTPAYFNGNIPWITTVALNGDVIDGNQAIEWITDEAIAKSAAKIVPPHSVMIGTRVGIGKVAINSVPMSTSQDIISLIGIDENKWDKKFICHLITANKEHLNSQARGATIKGIKIEVIADLVLPEISVKEQARVSEIIGKVDALICMQQQMARNLDQLIKSRFIELFGDPIMNPRGWQTMALEDNATLLNGRAYKQDELLDSGKYPVLRVGNFFSNRGWYYSNLELNEDKYCDNGDLLYAWSASFGPQIWNGGKVIYHYHIWKVLVGKAYNKQFLCNLLEYTTESLMNDTHGIAMMHLTKSGMEKTEFIVPPLELQEQFAAFVEQTDKSKLCGKMEVAA